MNAAFNAVTGWITDHPYQTAMHVANGVILCTPAAITVPVFSALGFSTVGPAAGKQHTLLPDISHYVVQL